MYCDSHLLFSSCMRHSKQSRYLLSFMLHAKERTGKEDQQRQESTACPLRLACSKTRSVAASGHVCRVGLALLTMTAWALTSGEAEEGGGGE